MGQLGKAVFLFLAAGGCLAAPPARGEAPSRGQQAYLCGDTERPMFAEAGRVGGARLMAPARPGLKSPSFLMPKPPGRPRVFVVGESVAGLLADGRYPGLEALAGPGVEVINCGMGGYDSRRILAVFREISGYAPDLVIVMSGNNETGREGCPGWRAALARAGLTVRTAFFRLFRGPKEAEREARLAAHRARLLSMAGIARAKGFPVVFCTLPANAELPPYGLPGGRQAGLDTLWRAALAAPRDPFAQYRLAEALRVSGDAAGAKEHYRLAVEWDNFGDRCSGERNAMIRTAAAEGGACLADLEGDFAGIAPDGIVGGGLLADGVHWYYGLNPFVAARLWRHIASCQAASARVFPSGLPSGFGARLAAAEERTLKDLSGTAQRREALRYRIFYAAAFLRHGAPELRERGISLLDAADDADRPYLSRLLKDGDALARALPVNLWVSDMRSSGAAWRGPLLAAAAEMWRRKGAAKAAADAEADAGPWAALSTAADARARAARLADSGAGKFSSGDLAGARADLLEALRLAPDNIPARITLCSALLRSGDCRSAAEQCGAAVDAARYPSPSTPVLPRALPDALMLRADAYERCGEPGKAAEDLRAALAAPAEGWPGSAEARARLSNLEERPE